jgi:hypothetical protein
MSINLPPNFSPLVPAFSALGGEMQFSLSAAPSPQIAQTSPDVTACSATLLNARAKIAAVTRAAEKISANGQGGTPTAEQRKALTESVMEMIEAIEEAKQACDGVIDPKKLDELEKQGEKALDLAGRLQGNGGAAFDWNGAARALGAIGAGAGMAIWELLKQLPSVLIPKLG